MTQIPAVYRQLPNPAVTDPLARQRSPFPAPAGKTLYALMTILEGRMLFHVLLTPDPEGCSALSLSLNPEHTQHRSWDVPCFGGDPAQHRSHRFFKCLFTYAVLYEVKPPWQYAPTLRGLSCPGLQRF